jgi:SnoaL-like polyketide cyclase
MVTSQLIEEGNTVVAEWVWRATNTGPLAMPDGTEIPAMHNILDVPALSVALVRDGEFASQRDYFDNADGMRQLGLMPSA